MKKILMKNIITENTQEETVLAELRNIISNTEWDNKVFLAGGAVRDEIMGLKPKDLDFVINGDITAGINFATWLAKTLGIYKKDSNPVVYERFGTAKLSLTKNNKGLPPLELEFVAPRKEEYTQGSRKPEVTGGDLKDDVFRRDLTINSLIKNVSTGEVLDLTGKGVDDIKNGIIRTTSEPDIIYNDDPLRMLRTVRFAVKYDFKLEDGLIDAIKRNADKIENISAERISDELNKILKTSKPAEGVALLKDTNLLKFIMPELQATVGMEQNHHHIDDVFGHTMSVLKNTPPELKTRLMALFHDIGKTATRMSKPDGGFSFIGHEYEGQKIAKDIMTRLKYPNELIDAVLMGIGSHMSLKHGNDDSMDASDKTLRKFAAKVGENLEDVLDLIHADNISHAPESAMPNQVAKIRERLKNLNTNVQTAKPKLPINGKDLLDMGYKQGPLFRDILNAVEDAWFDNPNLTRDEAIDIVKSFALNESVNRIKDIYNKIL